QMFRTVGGALEFLSIENACKVLDLPENAGTVTCDVFVDRGKTLTVNVQDAEGKPLAGATAAGLTASWPITFPLDGASCTVYALPPQRPRSLVFYHAGRKLAGRLTVRGDEKEAPAVRLGPAGSATGRIFDLDGQPIAGALVSANYVDHSARELERHLGQGREAARTDKDGRFRLEGVVPGMKFGLNLQKGSHYLIGEP